MADSGLRLEALLPLVIYMTDDILLKSGGFWNGLWFDHLHQAIIGERESNQSALPAILQHHSELAALRRNPWISANLRKVLKSVSGNTLMA